MTARRVHAFVLLLAIAALFAAAPSELQAIEVVTVEEHWELQLGEPDADLSAPQVTMTMAPTSDLSGRYFILTLNHQTDPNYTPGGLQIQRWEGDEAADSCSSDSVSALWHQNEVITWVQRLRLANGHLTFTVLDGESTSWDDFGDDELSLSAASDLANLNDYRPGLSIQESGVGYAGNRVRSLTLTRLIWTTADGQTFELTAPIDVDTDLDP